MGMEKITSNMKLDKVFEIMRKVFKGVYAVLIALPSANDGDVFIVAYDKEIKSLPEYKDLLGRKKCFDTRQGCYIMAGWIESFEFIFQKALVIDYGSFKGVSLPLALYNQINDCSIDIYNTIGIDRYELRFETKAFGGDLLFEKKLHEEDGAVFRNEKKLLETMEREDLFKVEYSSQTIVEYNGEIYTGRLFRDSNYFEFSEENTPKEITKRVEVIIPDSTSKAGEALYVLDLDGIMTKRLVDTKREVTETESVGFSLSADERRYEEDFHTSIYIVRKYDDDAVEITEKELPEAVKNDSSWKALENYLKLKESGEFERLVLEAKETARKEAKAKAEEFVKTLN